MSSESVPKSSASAGYDTGGINPEIAAQFRDLGISEMVLKNPGALTPSQPGNEAETVAAKELLPEMAAPVEQVMITADTTSNEGMLPPPALEQSTPEQPAPPWDLEAVRTDPTGRGPAAAALKAALATGDYDAKFPTGKKIPVPATDAGHELAQARADNKAFRKLAEDVAPAAPNVVPQEQGKIPDSVQPEVASTEPTELENSILSVSEQEKTELTPEPNVQSTVLPEIDIEAPATPLAEETIPKIDEIVPEPVISEDLIPATDSLEQPSLTTANTQETETTDLIDLHTDGSSEATNDLAGIVNNGELEESNPKVAPEIVVAPIVEVAKDELAKPELTVPPKPRGSVVIPKTPDSVPPASTPEKISLQTSTKPRAKPVIKPKTSVPEASDQKEPKKTEAKKTPREPKIPASEILTGALSPDKIKAAQELGKNLDVAPVGKTTDEMSRRMLGSLDSLVPNLSEPQAEGISPIEARLGQARNALAVLQSQERHGLIRHVDKTVLESAEATYQDVFKLRLVEKLKFEMEQGGSEKEVRLAAISLLSQEALDMSKAEVAVAETRRGGKLAKLWKDNPKWRVAIGVGLAATGIIATASGATTLGVIAIGGRAAMSGVGTYIAARRGISVASAHGTRTGQRSRAELNDEEVRNLGKNETYRRLSALLSSDELVTEASEKQKAKDAIMTEKLTDAMESYWSQRMLAGVNFGQASVAETATKILGERRSIDSAQLESDRQGNIKRTGAALIIASVAAGITVATGVKRLEGARPKIASKLIERPAIHKSGVIEAAAKHDVPSVHYESVHTVHSGDSIWKISHETLAKQDHNWSRLTSREQLIRTDRLKDLLLKQQGGKSLLMPGQKLKVPWAMVKNSMSYKQ